MFTGNNVRLRAEKKEDIALLTKIKNEVEVLENLTIYIPYPQGVEAGEYRFNEKIKDKYTKNPAFIIEKHDGTVIGQCGTMHTNWKNSYTIVWIYIGGAENRGCGYGAEALSLLVGYIFKQMNLNRVGLFVFDFNKRAIKSYEKIGFKLEGILRQELYRNGRYNDVYQMSILKSEYFSMSGGESHVL